MSQMSIRTLPTARLLNIKIALVLGGSLLMAIGAHLAVNLPFSPVPITGQTLALPLIVALLGTRGSVAAMLLYLAEGAVGLPVFAPTMTPGILALAGPTAGYLWAFPAAAYVIGALFDFGLSQRLAGRAIAIATGDAVVFGFGALWLSHFVGIDKAFTLGVAPFLIGDAIKVAIAAAAGGGATRLIPSLFKS